MRSPSRLLPKYAPKQNTIVGWIVVTILLSSTVYLCYLSLTKAPWVTLILVALGIVFHFYSTRKRRNELSTLANNRTGESICEFARSFDERIVDTWVIRAVYEELQHELAHAVDSFPIRATDSLTKDLNLNETDDLDFSVIPRIEQRTGRSIQDSAANPYFGKILTVSDLVLFFNSQPREDSQITNT